MHKKENIVTRKLRKHFFEFGNTHKNTYFVTYHIKKKLISEDKNKMLLNSKKHNG